MAKRKCGKRTDSGRLSRSRQALDERSERNPPSRRSVARQERFRHFRGDGSIGHEMTAAGRLMLVGAFDDMGVAPDVILSALLEYESGYWSYFGGGPQIASYGMRVDGTSPSVGGAIDPETMKLKDSAGEWFDMKDEVLRSSGYAARRAVHEITVDRHWFPDEDISWAARIINSRIMDKRKSLVRSGQPVPPELIVIGQTACDSDWAMLELLRYGATVLALGLGEKRRAA